MNRLKVFLKYPEKKSSFKMIKEIFILLIKKKEIPFYYFKYIYRKEVTNYLDYLSLQEQRELQFNNYLHDPQYINLINNKLHFSLLSERTSIKIPKLLSHNLKSSFSTGNKTIQIDNKDKLTHFFEEVFEENSIEGIFFRPPSDYGGNGCFKIMKTNMVNDLEEKYDILIKGDFVHTEVIKQHNEINKIHDKSINTLRMITLITSSGKTEIISVFMRFGVGDSVVDNASSGGFFVGVNMEKGTLKRYGHFLPEYGGEKIEAHPDTGFNFDGFTIPFYKEACEIVINAVKIIPDRLIGWDVAITPDGPVIIESNVEPHMQMSNIAYGGMLKNEHVKQLMQELKAMK